MLSQSLLIGINYLIIVIYIAVYRLDICMLRQNKHTTKLPMSVISLYFHNYPFYGYILIATCFGTEIILMYSYEIQTVFLLHFSLSL